MNVLLGEKENGCGQHREQAEAPASRSNMWLMCLRQGHNRATQNRHTGYEWPQAAL